MEALRNWFTEKELKEYLPRNFEDLVATETLRPERRNIFSAFENLPPQDVKVLLIGQDPYPKEGRADGMAFSFGDNKKPEDSLKNIFERLEELGIKNSNTKLTKWRDSGVLLLNAALTLNYTKDKNLQNKLKKEHLDAWTPFVSRVIARLIEKRNGKPLVIILMGRNANFIEQFKDDSKDEEMLKNNVCIIRTSHPSNLGNAKNYTGNYSILKNDVKAFMCETSNPFKKCNEFLEQKGVSPIDWNTD